MFIKGARQWIGSPLGLNILLSALKDGKPELQKYTQISKQLIKKNVCSTKSKVFMSPSYKLKDNIDILDCEETDFSQDKNAFTLWVFKNGTPKNCDVTKEFSSKTEFILANLTSLQSNWYSCKDTKPLMKVYNSFNYTQDVKYEARLLELPLQSSLKLLIVVPNEVDVLNPLFSILKHQGLDAAVRSIQPLFTANCELDAPNIELYSRVEDIQELNMSKATVVQHGSLIINAAGVNVSVLTCISSPRTTAVSLDQDVSVDRPFYLAIMYQDVPAFVGQFTQ